MSGGSRRAEACQCGSSARGAVGWRDTARNGPTQSTRLWVWWLKQARNIAFKICFNAPILLKIFQTMYIQECGKEFGSSRHCDGEMFFFTRFSSQTCLDCVGFQTKSQSHKTSAFGLGAFFLPGRQRWCHFTRGLSWGACGNRKQGMLQPFPSCQPNTRHDRISDAAFGAFVCLLTGYQFQWGIFERLKRLKAYDIISYPCKVQTVLEGLSFRMPASQGRQSGGRRMPGSQTVAFFSSLATRWILVAICCPFLDRSSCSLEAQFAVFVAIMSS